MKKVLGRATPPSPLPAEPQLQRSGELPSGDAASSASAEVADVVGSVSRKNKVIGFDIDIPQRLSGPALEKGLESAVTTVLGPGGVTISEEHRLGLAKEIFQQTGTRVPDFVLNESHGREDLMRHFAKQIGRGRTSVLELDQSKLPSNVKVT